MEKDNDSMVVKPVEYAPSEYSASSEAPPVSDNLIILRNFCAAILRAETISSFPITRRTSVDFASDDSAFYHFTFYCLTPSAQMQKTMS